MLTMIISFVRREFHMLVRYLLVGGSSFLVKAGTYAFISRLVWVDGPRSFQNIIAIVIATIYNYTLHRLWTFRHQAPAPGSIQRYVAVVIVGSSLDASLFYLGHDILKLYDFLVLILSSGITTIFSFTMHRLFSFHSNPWKKKHDQPVL